METNSSRPCPGCGSGVDTQYCPHCGSRTLPADEPVWSGRPRSTDDLDSPTVPSLPIAPRADGPTRAVPEMFPTEMVPTGATAPPQAWSQAPDPGAAESGPPSGLFPGWTGMHPAVATAGAQGALASRPERRRKAILAMAAIAVATVLVLLAALLIAPHLGSGNNIAEKDGRPIAADSAASSSTQASSTRPGDPSSSPPPTTVTVTAGTSPAAPVRQPATRATPKPTPPRPTPAGKATPTPAPAAALGVPLRDIVCSGGYIVQLASDFDAVTFAAHVARLKAVGQLPAGAIAADSAHSCGIFSNQRNTVVLYAGPFGSKYAGCPARLAGPADAFIQGGNPGSARDYVSCLCPANVAELPRVATVGQRNVWIGELQRVLGNRLNIDVNDLTGNWGVFTPATKAAVQQFQQSRRLPATGVVDTRTWKQLQSLGC